MFFEKNDFFDFVLKNKDFRFLKNMHFRNFEKFDFRLLKIFFKKKNYFRCFFEKYKFWIFIMR